MNIIVVADGLTQNQFNDKALAEGVQVRFHTSLENMAGEADAYFYLLGEETLEKNKEILANLGKPVFVHAIITTLDKLPKNVVRINGWPGFLNASSLEIAAADQNKTMIAEVLNAMGWDYNFVPDLVGMITPRTIAMIVNEAYFALEEKVSTKHEVDTAMKLGTGYPYGPFEWSEKIGLNNIYQLLENLLQHDSRYQPSALLTKETHSRATHS